MAQAFVIRPFGQTKGSSGKTLDFEIVSKQLIEPALVAADLGGGTTGELVEAGNIREDMFALILEADLVVCDITIPNANVFYELGIRHALRRRRTILIKGQPSDSTPFDLLTDRYLPYQLANPGASKEQLVATIQATMRSERKTDSPVFELLPSLAEADPSTVQVVPLDFREEVARACSAKRKGWLRLVAEEVRGRRFVWEGLRLVATAQWKLKDMTAAVESWEAIRSTYPNDVAANLALASIYERIYRDQRRPEQIKVSDQAIQRVLKSKDISIAERAEALALGGRNAKTRWRVQLENLDTVEERRIAGMNRALREAFEAYRDAFYLDLNHFYSGLTALQMGTVFLDLARGEQWKDAFDDDREAETYRLDLGEEVAALAPTVRASVEAALRRLDRRHPNRVWAEISKADVLFLTEGRDKRVIAAYEDAIPVDDPFAWDAARGQLELFADVGVREERANTVIAAIDGRIPPPKQNEPFHVVLFAGHRVDSPGRAERRFPANQEARARELIHSAVKTRLDRGLRVVGLASASAGSDILFHEVCDELEIPSSICLPMPSTDFARLAFADLDDWRSRFLDLVKGGHEVLELSHKEGLPNWLHGANLNPWERGNRWSMQMALASDAKEISLIALWDGQNTGDAPGGTAQLVALARNAGCVRLEIVDAKALV